jgi:large exoprotein involved in heme utilization and adhesion
LQKRSCEPALGKIEISHSSAPRPEINGLEIVNVDTSGEGGGSIFIRGGQFVMNHSRVFADNWGTQDSLGGIDIQADTLSLARSFITAEVLASGRGGNISIKTGSLELMDFSIIDNGSQVFFDDEGNLFTGSGNAGTIEIKARDTIKMSFSGIANFTEGEGDAGNISIETGSLELMDRSWIGSDSQTGFFTRGPPGNAGTIEIKVRDTIKISDSTISTSTMSEGDAGNISIEAGSLELIGNVNLEILEFDGHEFEFETSPSYISSSSEDSRRLGNAGTIEIKVRDTIVLSGSGTTISTSTVSSGAGGAIRIDATDIELSNGGTISAESSGTGLAGQIFIKALDNLRLVNGSQISVATTQADAGDITLEVGNLLHLGNDSSITTSAAGGTGKGGNITLNSVFVVLDEGSSIIANALEGQGGNILIRILGGGALFQSPDSRIEASSEFGIDGSVVIDAPDTDIIAGFVGLPANFLDAATVLTQLCAELSGANVSSLVVRKYEVLPDSPYALRVQLPRLIPTLGTAKRSHAPRTYYAGSPLPPMLSCLGNG